MTDDEMIRAIGEKVMDWASSAQQADGQWWVRPTPDDVPMAYGVLHPFDPLRWDGDACMVLDRMVEQGYSYSLREFRPFNGEEWERGCCFYQSGSDLSRRTVAPDRRRAICLAALKAIASDET